MPTPRLKPVTEIKRHAVQVFAQLRRTGEPILITERGRPAAVLLDIESYEVLLRRLEVLQGIARGERALAAGRVVSHTEARRRLGKRLAPRS